jgi:preprotein translocase subunit SecB
MKNSPFQFKDPVLTNLVFELCRDFKPSEHKEIEFKNDFKIRIAREEKATNAVVSLTVSVNDGLNDVPFYCTATMMADFKWDETIEESIVEILLNQNAPSLLLSYLRPLIANIIGASQFPAYNIPFINFKNSQEES